MEAFLRAQGLSEDVEKARNASRTADIAGFRRVSRRFRAGEELRESQRPTRERRASCEQYGGGGETLEVLPRTAIGRFPAAHQRQLLRKSGLTTHFTPISDEECGIFHLFSCIFLQKELFNRL